MLKMIMNVECITLLTYNLLLGKLPRTHFVFSPPICIWPTRRRAKVICAKVPYLIYVPWSPLPLALPSPHPSPSPSPLPFPCPTLTPSRSVSPRSARACGKIAAAPAPRMRRCRCAAVLLTSPRSTMAVRTESAAATCQTTHALPYCTLRYLRGVGWCADCWLFHCLCVFR